MSAVEFVRSFMTQATTSGTRSTALQPLAWLAGILSSGLVISVFFESPTWVSIVFAVSVVITVVTYIGSYVYCLFNRPDSLRSETFTLSKIALEKNLVGDNRSGFIEVSDAPRTEIATKPDAVLPDQTEGRNP